MFHADAKILVGLSATRKLSFNRVREAIEANRRGTWTIKRGYRRSEFADSDGAT